MKLVKTLCLILDASTWLNNLPRAWSLVGILQWSHQAGAQWVAIMSWWTTKYAWASPTEAEQSPLSRSWTSQPTPTASQCRAWPSEGCRIACGARCLWERMWWWLLTTCGWTASRRALRSSRGCPATATTATPFSSTGRNTTWSKLGATITNSWTWSPWRFTRWRLWRCRIRCLGSFQWINGTNEKFPWSSALSLQVGGLSSPHPHSTFSLFTAFSIDQRSAAVCTHEAHWDVWFWKLINRRKKWGTV